jgi:aspartate racemase
VATATATEPQPPPSEGAPQVGLPFRMPVGRCANARIPGTSRTNPCGCVKRCQRDPVCRVLPYAGPMRLLGVLGGMSWTSTVEYYRLLNRGVAQRLGGHHSARLLLHSVDFGPVADMQHDGDWDGTAKVLVEAAQGLERADAEGLLVATNTMHKVADEISGAIGIPLLHIADATATRVLADGRRSVGLLATAFTMEQEFYTGRLRDLGLEVLVPEADERADVHRIIYDELVLDVVRDESRERYREVMATLADRGAEGIILGCTEIGLLVGEQDSPVPLYDTTAIHADEAVDWMLA